MGPLNYGILMKSIKIMAFGDFFCEKVEPRRRQEERDSKMIGTGSGSIANLPKEPIHKEFNIGFQVERFKNESHED